MKSNSVFQIGIAIIVSALMIIYAATSFAQPPKGGPPMMQSGKAPKGGAGGKPGPGGKGGSFNFIGMFDKNKDRKVSKDEFTGPDFIFSNFDRNGDGVIEKSEAPKNPPAGGKIPGLAVPKGRKLCYDVPEYQGINAIPAVTMQILPSASGGTVTNDRDHPPGKGPLVVVGFWEHPVDYVPKEGETPCDGEPNFKIAYPVSYGPDQCYSGTHWAAKDDPHYNSTNDFICEDGGISYTQFITPDCTGDAEGYNPNGRRKSAWVTKCCQDFPPVLWSQILDFCGCDEQ